jgi:GPH family glycoside/pentoside/hexuronide:cation symporter
MVCQARPHSKDHLTMTSNPSHIEIGLTIETRKYQGHPLYFRVKAGILRTTGSHVFLMPKEGDNLPQSIQIGWAVGELGIATYVGITMIYMLFYLTQALNISPIWAGIALLIPRLWDVITDPIMGAISDRTNTRMGRRRPFLLVGGILFGTSFILIFFAPPHAPEWIRILYVTIMYIVASTAYTIYDVPYSAMVPEMTSDYKERTTLTGYKMIAARIGIVLCVTVAPWLFHSRGTLADGFRFMGLVFGAFMTLTGLYAFFATKKAPQIAVPLHKFSLRAEFNAIRYNRPFRILWTVFLFQNLAIGAAASTLIYFLIFVIKVDDTLLGPMLSVGAVTATLATPFWISVARRIGKREAYYLGLVITAIMSLPALIIPTGYIVTLFIVLLLAGIGDACNQLAANSMVPDTVEFDELRTGERREGAIFGAWAFCRKLGMAAGAFLVSIGLSLFGFESGNGSAIVQSDTAVLGIRITYALLPFSLWVAAILMLGKYKLNERQFNEIKAEIRSKAVHVQNG